MRGVVCSSLSHHTVSFVPACMMRSARRRAKKSLLGTSHLFSGLNTPMRACKSKRPEGSYAGHSAKTAQTLTYLLSPSSETECLDQTVTLASLKNGTPFFDLGHRGTHRKLQQHLDP